MNIRSFLTDFALTFAVVLVVSAIVTFFYSLVAHGEGLVDADTSFRLAIILGIVLPLHHRGDTMKGTASQGALADRRTRG